MKALSGVFAIGEDHIGDDIHNPAVRFLRETLILAAVSLTHMDN